MTVQLESQIYILTSSVDKDVFKVVRQVENDGDDIRRFLDKFLHRITVVNLSGALGGANQLLWNLRTNPSKTQYRLGEESRPSRKVSIPLVRHQAVERGRKEWLSIALRPALLESRT